MKIVAEVIFVGKLSVTANSPGGACKLRLLQIRIENVVTLQCDCSPRFRYPFTISFVVTVQPGMGIWTVRDIDCRYSLLCI